MIKSSKKFIASLAVLLLITGLFAMTAIPSPASASTTVTINVSGNIDQDTLNNYIEKILRIYNINPDDVIIKYSNGKTSKYSPNCESPAAPKAPQPQPESPKPNPAPNPKPNPAPNPEPNPEPSPAPSSLNADEQKMLSLVNQERARIGLPALKANLELTKLARLKAKNMIDLGYFSHTSPTYGSPFDMMKSAGINYRYAGENLAGAYSVDTAHKNLMNSPGHRANILNQNFNEVGIGIVDGGPYGKMFVQMFIG